MVDDPSALLRQAELEEWFRTKHGTDRWTTIYRRRDSHVGVGLYVCLIPPDGREQSLRDPSWDLRTGDGGPGFSQGWESEEYVTTYHRVGELDGVEPLVIVRHFHHGRPDHVEIAEDLRLLFNLYEDRTAGVFYEAGDDGSETEVIRVSADKVEIRTSLLRRYLAARQLALVLEIVSDVQLRLDVDALMPELPAERRVETDSICLHCYSGTHDARRPYSVLMGKKIIMPPARSECGIWPFEPPREYANFIIGEDERGRPIEHTCDPETLANHFGKNADAPHYLTPVFFRREVLRKYYENGERFEVKDGSVGCGGLWILRADTNHGDHVTVFLGDLGRDLPNVEQRHWRAYNLMPEDRTLSETAFRRSLRGEFAEAVLPEHRFKQTYAAANAAWQVAFDWPLFKELHPDDRHVLSSLRLPLADTADEFDGQVLDLAKLTVDSLNEERIEMSLTAPHKGDKGIAKFERLLTERKYANVARDMALLRAIQGVRSKGAAHRKGSDYNLAQAGLDPSDLPGSFRSLLDGCIQMLNNLETFAKEQADIG